MYELVRRYDPRSGRRLLYRFAQSAKAWALIWCGLYLVAVGLMEVCD